MDRPRRIHTYTTPIYDSARWDHWKPRAGDILVCTPSKSGTTWTQMLCALLVHQSPELPQPLTRLSRWLDRLSEPVENVIADFEAQNHRRVIKTHTPLDGLPYWEDAAYVFCGRDPRDAFLSMRDHMQNVSPESMAEALERAGLPKDFRPPEDPDAAFRLWLTVGEVPWMRDGFPVGSVLGFSESYWAHRRLPNLFFLHYADLRADCDAEMRRLSAFLRIPVDESRWPALVEAAGFEAMKRGADDTAPGAHLGEWSSNADFFRRARMGDWQSGLSPESLTLYEEVSRERLDPALKAWLEGGRAVAGDPRSA